MFMRFYKGLLFFSFALFLRIRAKVYKSSKPGIMKKMKLIVICILALPLVTNLKASNCLTTKKEKAVAVVKTHSANEPGTLIEQILFPHGI
jgi:hypothetical protein